MTQHGTHEVEHEITAAAPAAEVYRLLADVVNWPRIFPPTIHVDRDDLGGNRERIRIWATANGEPKNWSSQRTLHPDELRIDFRQEVSAPPVASMSGAWLIEPLGEDRCRIRLLHTYRAIDDDPEGLAWIDRAVDSNSRSELDALRENVELAHATAEVTFSFEDSVSVRGSAKDLYDFVNEAQLWQERLPHVDAVRLQEDTPGLQRLRMDTRAKDGSTHTTESYRVCLPHERIAYKQVTLPPLMSLHTGLWTFQEADDGTVTATSQHTVVLNTANITRVLGEDASPADARSYVQGALSANSLATLSHARDHAEKAS